MRFANTTDALDLEEAAREFIVNSEHRQRSGGYRGGGKPGLCPPLTNKDTPPVHCNEFNYMSSATHCRSSRPVVRIKYNP